MKQILLITGFFLFLLNGFSQQSDTIYLWPNKIPGESAPRHRPVVTDNKSGGVTRITDITNPAIISFKSENVEKKNVSILVCPGGAYKYLAIDKEGYEVAQWLVTLGFDAYVLQYRAPDKREGALQDIQRALRTIRNIDSTQIVGLMGFSAGGNLSAMAATNFKKKTYEPEDEIDRLSCRPDFAALLYPAYLDEGDNQTLSSEITIDNSTPPFFIFSTADDAYGNSGLVMTTALLNKKIPVELHVIPLGGHGYGLRKGNIAAETWPELFLHWMNYQFKPIAIDH